MKHTILKMGMVALMLAAFTGGAVAQHEEHHPEGQATQPQATQPKTENSMQPGTAGPGMMGGMMAMMMGQNQQMGDMSNKLMQNMAAMQNEKDPAKMRSMMAEQSAMMQQMRDQMMQQRGMMQNMSGMMSNCPMMGAGGQAMAPSNPSGK